SRAFINAPAEEPAWRWFWNPFRPPNLLSRSSNFPTGRRPAQFFIESRHHRHHRFPVASLEPLREAGTVMLDPASPDDLDDLLQFRGAKRRFASTAQALPWERGSVDATPPRGHLRGWHRDNRAHLARVRIWMVGGCLRVGHLLAPSKIREP